jgi:protein-disulfide isomerase
VRRALSGAALTVTLWASACSGQTATVTIDPTMTRGSDAAPVTILEFSDFQCPYCKRAQDTLEQVMREFPGRVRIVFKDFPLDFHPGARPAALAARCAGAGGRFWEYHDLLFVAQPDFEREDLLRYAERIGLERASFAECLDSGRFRDAVERDMTEGRALGITGTPTFFVNGRRLVGAMPVEAFREAVRAALTEDGK